MKDFILLAITLFFLYSGNEKSVFAVSSFSQSSLLRTCQSTADCGEDSCCRDIHGNVITGFSFGPFEISSSQRTGICANKAGRNGTVCSQHCGCEPGLTCYRPMTGMCCVPPRCYDSEWVRQEEEKWRNCFPPKCHFPV